MKQIKTTLREWSVIQHIANQIRCMTGKPLNIHVEYKRGGVQVTAPVDFLAQLGF